MGNVESYEDYILILNWDVLGDYPRRSDSLITPTISPVLKLVPQLPCVLPQLLELRTSHIEHLAQLAFVSSAAYIIVHQSTVCLCNLVLPRNRAAIQT